jgi:hypothetical protein
LSLEACRYCFRETVAELLQGFGWQFLDQQFNEQTSGWRTLSCISQAAFSINCLAHSGGAMGKPKRLRLS